MHGLSYLTEACGMCVCVCVRVSVCSYPLPTHSLRRGRQGVDPVGALSYRISPPEVLINHTAPRTTAGDVYAFGITMLEIVTGQPVFRSFQNNEIVKAGKAAQIFNPCTLHKYPYNQLAFSVCAVMASAYARHFTDLTLLCCGLCACLCSCER